MTHTHNGGLTIHQAHGGGEGSLMAGLSDPVLSALSAPGCTTEEFYHNEKSIEIDGTVESCENS